MRVLVTGSRNWSDRSAISRRLQRLPLDATVVHGAASRKQRGIEQSADMLADDVANTLGLRTERWPADWKQFPRAAGVIRNVAMLDSGIDLVLAFQRDGSRGTQHAIDEARRRGIPVEISGAA
jgi:hypothetical protein